MITLKAEVLSVTFEGAVERFEVWTQRVAGLCGHEAGAVAVKEPVSHRRLDLCNPPRHGGLSHPQLLGRRSEAARAERRIDEVPVDPFIHG